MSKETQVHDGVDDNLVRPAFTRKYLDSEREDTGDEVITIRLNREERQAVERLKRQLHYGQDAKVFKAGLIVLQNVIHASFGEVLMGKLTDADRRRVLFDDAQDQGGGRNL